MRRLCATFALVVLSLSVFPARAEAYFWAWLDDLSGPQFAGFLLEVQVMCKGKQVADSEHAILRLIESNELERIKYGARPREQYPSTAYPYLNSAQAYIKRSNDLLNYALNDLKPGQNA